MSAFSFDADTHTYRDHDGTVVPSVTQVLAAVWPAQYAGIREEVLQRKSALGTAVHLACHMLDTPDEGMLDWSKVHPEARPYIEAYQRFKSEQHFRVAESELQGIATVRGMRYGYQIDKRGFMGKWATILDLKCAVDEKPLWRLQLAGYELAEAPMSSLRNLFKRAEGDGEDKKGERLMSGWWRCALVLRKDGGYRLYQYRDPRDKDMFLCALACVWWGKNHGIHGQNDGAALPAHVREEDRAPDAGVGGSSDAQP